MFLLALFISFLFSFYLLDNGELTIEQRLITMIVLTFLLMLEQLHSDISSNTRVQENILKELKKQNSEKEKEKSNV